jgi:hypothetical protein
MTIQKIPEKVVKSRINSCPTVVFGDIHGLTYWKKVVAENPSCRYIFLGDYLDPYEYIEREQLINNLQEIIHLKNNRNDDVILLLGNHDLHYFSSDMDSGSRFDFDIAEEASKLFRENIHLFMYAFQEENRIFTHAGISERWFFNGFIGNADQNIAAQLNNPLPAQVAALCRCGAMRGGNWNAVGGIFWADISELNDPLPGYTQFVGHNRVDDIHEHTNNGGRIIFCDCLYNKKYLKLDF